MRVLPPKTGFAVAALLALCLGRPALFAADAQATREKPADALVSTPLSQPRSTLLQPGAEPHKALRLHPKAGDKHTSTLTLKMTMEVHAGTADAQPMKMPPMTLVMDTTIKSVSAGGDISFDTVMREVSVAEDSQAAPQMVDAMKTALSGVKGLSINGTMSNRGISKRTEVTPPADTNPQAQQMIEQMKDAFSNSGVVFPEEAVGPGAKWVVKQKVKSQGLTLDQTTTCELVSVEGDRLKVKTVLTQSAANQEVKNPSLPDAKVNVVKLQSRGTGEISANLGQLMPVQATSDLRNESNMAVSAGGQDSEMTIKMDMNQRLETK